MNAAIDAAESVKLETVKSPGGDSKENHDKKHYFIFWQKQPCNFQCLHALETPRLFVAPAFYLNADSYIDANASLALCETRYNRIHLRQLRILYSHKQIILGHLISFLSYLL